MASINSDEKSTVDLMLVTSYVTVVYHLFLSRYSLFLCFSTFDYDMLRHGSFCLCPSWSLLNSLDVQINVLMFFAKLRKFLAINSLNIFLFLFLLAASYCHMLVLVCPSWWLMTTLGWKLREERAAYFLSDLPRFEHLSSSTVRMGFDSNFTDSVRMESVRFSGINVALFAVFSMKNSQRF